MREQQQDWDVNDPQSPYYVWGMMTHTEWQTVVQSYPYSVRVLVELYNETRWSEQGRSQTETQASALMHGLAHLHRTKNWWIGWTVVKTTCLDGQVRERPVLWYPSQEHILQALQKGGLVPSNSAPGQRRVRG